MKFRIRPPLLRSTRSRRSVRWSRCFFLIAGFAALVYVGVTLLEARLFQASALQSLKNPSQSAENPKVSQLKEPDLTEGDVVGRIDIPRLGMSVAVLQGTNWRVLRLGAGHIEGTPLPGEPGNSGIAGHRDTVFRNLQEIHRNDEIHIQTATGRLRYEVDWVKIVEPNDTTVLEPSTAESTLTLVTCYPFQFLGAAPKRFVVHARQN